MTLTAILILISGAAAIRLAQIVFKPRPVPKILIHSPSSVPLASPSTPQLYSKLTVPDKSEFYCEKIIERDITFSFPFAHPESPPSSPKRVPAFLREEEEDIAAMLSVRAGEESVCRRGHKEKKQSESSLTTASTALDSLCPSLPRSSVTSVYSISINSYTEDEEELDMEEVEIYEVKRAQTQSMEVKRGVLMSYRSSQPPSPIPEMPTFVISESSSDTYALSNTAVDDSLLQALPSLLVTHPSDVSLVSTTSSVSVDLDEFPLPPTLPPIPKTDYGNFPLLLVVPDDDGPVIQMSREEKRSTVEQVITMYE